MPINNTAAAVARIEAELQQLRNMPVQTPVVQTPPAPIEPPTVQMYSQPDPQTDSALAARLLAEIEALKQQNETLKQQTEAAKQPQILCKVSEKGAVSVFGMGAWPVTLYRSQWDKLLANTGTIQAFIEANAYRLATKN